MFQRHARILQDESIPVVATATRLYDEVRRHRTRNLALVTNGVDLQHFSLRRTEPPPAELQPILARKKPIIGYFGALAAWFDYELVLRVARERDYEVVLLGHDYDHSLQAYALNSQPNLHRLGPVPYSRLPSYACWFDVSTIPFRRNVITESTSPIKLFEYMALGTPIVATDIPECRKYRSVLIGHDADEFLRRLDEALMLRSDPGYCSQLSQDAVANTWESKAAMIADLLRL